MEKKAYISPNIEVVNISAKASILTGSNDVNAIGGGTFGKDITGGNGGSRSNGHRGSWSAGW